MKTAKRLLALLLVCLLAFGNASQSLTHALELQPEEPTAQEETAAPEAGGQLGEPEPATEPAVPEAEPVTEATAAETKPVTEPTIPETEPMTEPTIAETKPVTEPTAAETEPVTVPTVAEIKPVIEPTAAETEPVTEPTVAETEPVTEPTTAETKPVTEPTVAETEPVTVPTAAETEPVTVPTIAETKPVTEPTAAETKPVTESTAAETEPVTVPTVAETEPDATAPSLEEPAEDLIAPIAEGDSWWEITSLKDLVDGTYAIVYKGNTGSGVLYFHSSGGKAGQSDQNTPTIVAGSPNELTKGTTVPNTSWNITKRSSGTYTIQSATTGTDTSGYFLHLEGSPVSGGQSGSVPMKSDAFDLTIQEAEGGDGFTISAEADGQKL